jgi:ribosomal protein L29
MSTQGLLVELKNHQEALFKLKFQKIVEEFKDVTQLKKTKRSIAVILTLLKQMELKETQPVNSPE